ncbi:hypothetical protein LSAT2_014547, partial [Lamellibrachia satsuma]
SDISPGASCYPERHVTRSVMSPGYHFCHLCVVVVCGCWSRRSVARVNLTTSPNTQHDTTTVTQATAHWP